MTRLRGAWAVLTGRKVAADRPSTAWVVSSVPANTSITAGGVAITWR